MKSPSYIRSHLSLREPEVNYPTRRMETLLFYDKRPDSGAFFWIWTLNKDLLEKIVLQKRERMFCEETKTCLPLNMLKLLSVPLCTTHDQFPSNIQGDNARHVTRNCLIYALSIAFGTTSWNRLACIALLQITFSLIYLWYIII